jgi:hypothetical protein
MLCAIDVLGLMLDSAFVHHENRLMFDANKVANAQSPYDTIHEIKDDIQTEPE